MKKLSVIALAVLIFTACKQNGTATVEDKVAGTETTAPAVLAEDAPKFEFDKVIHDFGKIVEGEKVQASFKFKNTGKTPLIISNATATCGCTVPEYPKTPVKPGEEGVISVVFDSHNKVGMQDKAVTITSNANPEAEQLHLVGEVTAKK